MPDHPIPPAHSQPQLRDPRYLNQRCDVSSIGAYLCDYADRLRAALLTVDASQLDHARLLVEAAAQNGQPIYVIGNGGSAAIANHLCCDLTKGTHAQGHPVVDATSMTANMA